MTIVLFLIAAVILIGLIGVIWRLWQSYVRVSPDDEAFEREIASLNDAQANRLSDQQLTRPIDTETGWHLMVQRGQEDTRRRRRQRPPRS
jgi:uncharacterized membrane protein YqiK